MSFDKGFWFLLDAWSTVVGRGKKVKHLHIPPSLALSGLEVWVLGNETTTTTSWKLFYWLWLHVPEHVLDDNLFPATAELKTQKVLSKHIFSLLNPFHSPYLKYDFSQFQLLPFCPRETFCVRPSLPKLAVPRLWPREGSKYHETPSAGKYFFCGPSPNLAAQKPYHSKASKQAIQARCQAQC